MFLVVNIQYVSNAWQILALGPFATLEAANGWLAAQQNPGLYQVICAWNPVPATPGGPLSPAALSVGEWVSVQVFVDVNSLSQAFAYGPFASQALAAAFGQGTIYAANYGTAMVVTPPPS